MDNCCDLELIVENEEELSMDVTSENEIQIDTSEIMIIDNSGQYFGEIKASDWVLYGTRYRYILARNVYNLTNPSVSSANNETEEGYENALPSYVLLPNGDIRFVSDVGGNVKYRIEGEK